MIVATFSLEPFLEWIMVPNSHSKSNGISKDYYFVPGGILEIQEIVHEIRRIMSY